MNGITRYAVIETALCIGSNLMEGEVFMVMATDHDRELAALREELESTKAALREEMKDAFEFQQRNAELFELLKGLVSAGDWYTSALEFHHDQDGDDWLNRIEALTKLTESGASE